MPDSIETYAKEFWEKDRKIPFTELFELYSIGFKRGFEVGQSAATRPINDMASYVDSVSVDEHAARVI